jgi:hypothetical protein
VYFSYSYVFRFLGSKGALKKYFLSFTVFSNSYSTIFRTHKPLNPPFISNYSLFYIISYNFHLLFLLFDNNIVNLNCESQFLKKSFFVHQCSVCICSTCQSESWKRKHWCGFLFLLCKSRRAAQTLITLEKHDMFGLQPSASI